MAGVGLGLAMGALFIVGGMGRQLAEHAQAERMAEAAARGYAGLDPDAGTGLTLGLTHYEVRAGSETQTVASRFSEGRSSGRVARAADLECMTDAVYYEARSESARGQAAVAQVVMNRVRHPAYPKSVCGVVFQGTRASSCQFSFACDGSMRQRREAGAWSQARRVAAQALAGAVVGNIGAATHYHTIAVSPAWAPQMLRVAQVGVHVFYRLSPRRARLLAAEPGQERLVLTSAPVSVVPEVKLAPAGIEAVVEESLREPTPGEPSPAAKAPEAVALGARQDETPTAS